MQDTRRRCRTFLAALTTLLSAAAAAPADQACEVARVFAQGGAVNFGFGTDVDLHGDVFVVGSDRDGENEQFRGAAHVYRRVGAMWIEEAKLLAPAGDAGIRFGAGVATTGDRVFVGGLRADDEYAGGTVYVFRFEAGAWLLETRVIAPVDQTFFGRSIAVHADALLVGDPDDHDDAGAAYVFRNGEEGWQQESRLVASDGQPGDAFGIDVALDDGIAIVGADLAREEGAAYAYHHSNGTWTEEGVFEGEDGRANDRFGRAVAVSGDVAMVGARLGDGAAPNSGAVSVFRYVGGTWAAETVLRAAGGRAGDSFGEAVAVHRDRAVVGAGGVFDGIGAAYVFRFEDGAWGADGRLEPAGLRPNGGFGTAVTVDDDVTVATSIKTDEGGSGSGTSIVFTLAPPDCNANGTADCADIGSGFSRDCNGNGVPDECESDAAAGAVAGRRLDVPAGFGTIQAALDAAVHGDEVVIADGVYRGPGNRDLAFDGKRIVVRSASCDPALCIIDCEDAGRGFVFTGYETPDSRLSGVTIVNGRAPGDDSGGGILCGENSGPTIIDCVFEDGLAELGGGVAVVDASPRLIACAFVGNDAMDGGGVHVAGRSLVEISGCSFVANGGLGGGLVVGDHARVEVSRSEFTGHRRGAIRCSRSALAIAACTFLGNVSYQGSGIRMSDSEVTIEDSLFLYGAAMDGNGGAIDSGESSSTISRCSFIGNWASIGGAIHDDNGASIITDCVFRANLAYSWGGGIYSRGRNGPTIIDCVFADNLAFYEGGAIFSVESGFIMSSRFCGNAPNDISGDYEDGGGNEFAETCPPCAGDVDGDAEVGANDLLIVLASWGPCFDCASDLDGDAHVGFSDVAIVLAGWGGCPRGAGIRRGMG